MSKFILKLIILVVFLLGIAHLAFSVLIFATLAKYIIAGILIGIIISFLMRRKK